MKAKGTLNSKVPNPFEIAYKELWDKLPAWKRAAITEDIAAGRRDTSSTYHRFISDVSQRAEAIYAVTEGA